MVDHFWILNHDEWAYIETFEEEHKCSGMCRTPLFYYDSDVSTSPPRYTCLKVIIEPVQKAAGAIGSASHAVGVIALLVLCVHFFMYNRKYTAEPNWQPGMRPGETAVDAAKRMSQKRGMGPADITN